MLVPDVHRNGGGSSNINRHVANLQHEHNARVLLCLHQPEFQQQSNSAHCTVMGIKEEQAHPGPRVVADKLVEVSVDRKRVQVAAEVQHSRCKVLSQKTMAMLATDLSIHGELARQTTRQGGV